jgi:hypothetical protein
MKTWAKYGLINSLLGLVIGIFVTITSLGGGYYSFIIVIPISMFLTGSLSWKFIIKDSNDKSKVFITGLFTGTLSHYLTYWTTGNCTSSLNEPPESILNMLGAGFVYSFFSLIFFGWLTIIFSIATGHIILRSENKKLKKDLN